MSATVDNVSECLTIEIQRPKKNFIISCLYRTPGSNIEALKSWIVEHYSTTSHKVFFIGGDINIDLLNPNKYSKTEEFIDTMFSIGLYPKITRPSRITSLLATLIDDIFINEIDNNTVGRLLINNISDHLPVFYSI